MRGRLYEKLTRQQVTDRIGESQWSVHRGEIGSRRVDVAEFIACCRGRGGAGRNGAAACEAGSLPDVSRLSGTADRCGRFGNRKKGDHRTNHQHEIERGDRG